MATRLDDTEVRKNLTNLPPKLEAALVVYGETAAKDFESYAKSHRPWTDRTGEARRRLNGYTEKVSNGVRICIAHGVSYGIYLEFAHEKRYAILEPTVRLKSNDVLKGLKSLFNNLKV